MPELPEVEAARAILAEHCEGRKIIAVDAQEDAKIFEGASAEQVTAALTGRTLVAVGRKGKNLWFTLSGEGPMPLVHFGMTGYIAVRDAADGKVHIVAYENAPQDATGSWPPRFHKLLLHFGPHPSNPASPSCELAYCDARRFGRVKLVEGDPGSSETITKLGFDPLLEMPDLAAFTALLVAKGKGAARLKPLLLDQSFCAGVGNWVADEVLWHSRLHPEQPVAALQQEHIAALHQALHNVVQTAVAANADSSKFPPDWMFHVRWGKKAGTLAGHKIDHITVGSRTSCYVPAVQKLIGGAGKPSTAAAKKPATGRKRLASRQEEDDGQQESKEEDNGNKEQEAAASGRPAGSRGKKATVAKNSGKQQPRKKPAKQAAEKPDKAAADGEQQQDSKPDTAAAKKKQKGTAALSDGAKRKRHRS